MRTIEHMARHHTPDRIIDDPVAPTRLGPAGARARTPNRGFFTPVNVLILITMAAAIIAGLLKTPCRLNGWGQPLNYFAGCYSDWTALYSTRGLTDNPLAPLTAGAAPGTEAVFEYPVLMSAVAAVTALITKILRPVISFVVEVPASLVYFDVNFFFTVALWIGVVVLTAAIARRATGQPAAAWQAAMVACAPGIIFAGFINWDMWAVAAMMASLYAYQREKLVLTGILIGLGTATKIFPLFLLGAILIHAVRTRTFFPFITATSAAAGAWLAVNLPLMFFNPAGWQYFYTFSAERPPGWSSVWNAWNTATPEAWNISAEAMGTASTLLFALACAGIFALGILAPRTPTAPELMLLIVASFILVNKVYSPQFVLWLIPLVALAWPNWRDFLIWQFIEVLHFWAVWMHLAAVTQVHQPQHLLDKNVYVLAVVVHMVMVIYLGLRVIFSIIYDDAAPAAVTSVDAEDRELAAENTD